MLKRDFDAPESTPDLEGEEQSIGTVGFCRKGQGLPVTGDPDTKRSPLGKYGWEFWLDYQLLKSKQLPPK